MVNDVLVITGIGGMGSACARRLGNGVKLVLADFDAAKLAAFAEHMAQEGYDVEPVQIDVADPASVARLADTAAALGRVAGLVHTAGLSPNQAAAERVCAVNLLGTALMIDAFERIATPGMSAVFIASMARFVPHPSAELLRNLACVPSDRLIGLIGPEWLETSGKAYSIAKLGNYERVRAVAARWGSRGARINTISPGIISTPMSHLEKQHTPGMDKMLAMVPMGRMGSAEDIACAAEFLLGGRSTFVSGSDILVDGGLSSASAYAEQPTLTGAG